jgi:hypothetical protein
MSGPLQKDPQPLTIALRNLREFVWESGPLVAKHPAPPWNEQALIDNKYGRELTDAERAYEQRHYACFHAVQTQMGEFQKLTGLCSRFVEEVIHSGRQDILGRRANLDPNPIKRPSRTIHYDRVGLPDANETIPQYTKRIGGTHVLWARLLWWCAAAQSPADFGYEQTFHLELAGQPFWVARRKDGLHFSTDILGYLREAASQVAAVDPYPASVNGALPSGTSPIGSFISRDGTGANQGRDTGQQSITPSIDLDEEDDRPEEPNGCGKGLRFWWNGKSVKLDPKEYQLMEFLDPAMQKGASIGEIRDILWPGKDPRSSHLSSLLTDIRKKFDEAELGINVRPEVRALGTEKQLFIIPLEPGERAKRSSSQPQKFPKKRKKK